MTTKNIRGTLHTYELTTHPDTSITLVFLHGWLLSRHYWQPLVQRLATEYSCLTYDQRGFGDSCSACPDARCPEASASGDDLPFSPKDYAEDLGLLLNKLGVGRAWLVGHSLGGTIALWSAALYPEVVEGVVCLNAGGGIYLQKEFEQFRGAGQQMLKLRPAWLARVPFLDLPFRFANAARPLEPRWGRQRLLDFLAAEPIAARETLLQSTTAAAVEELPDLVSRLSQPVYFIGGQEDTIMPPRFVQHLASFHRLAAKNVVILPQCGHLAMLEQTEAVACQLRQIITVTNAGVEA